MVEIDDFDTEIQIDEYLDDETIFAAYGYVDELDEDDQA